MKFVLGIFDLLAGIFIAGYMFFHIKIAWIFGLYLVIKGIVFIKDVASVVDLIAGIVFFLVYFGVFSWSLVFVVVWLLQKGIFSLLQ